LYQFIAKILLTDGISDKIYLLKTGIKDMFHNILTLYTLGQYGNDICSTVLLHSDLTGNQHISFQNTPVNTKLIAVTLQMMCKGSLMIQNHAAITAYIINTFT
jgi:hypothetical protein